MKHAAVQSLVAGILLLGAQGVARAAAESVDADASMSVSPGDGAGVFVQYASGGHWNVFTACDTNRSNQPCRYDLIISVDPPASISGPEGHDLEPVDVLSLRSDGSIRLQTGTAGRLDGVTFDTEPGATIHVDLLLDGEAQPDLFNWVSGGETSEGTTENPVDFTPTSP